MSRKGAAKRINLRIRYLMSLLRDLENRVSYFSSGALLVFLITDMGFNKYNKLF